MEKKLHKIHIILFISCVCWSGFGQQALLKLANNQFDKQQYISAQKTYLLVIEKNYESANVYKNLADTYYYNGQFEKASIWYKKLIDSYSEEIDSEYFFRYSQSLKSTEDYNNADIYMEKFSRLKKNDIRANLYTKQKDYLARIEYQSNRYEMHRASINSEFSDFGTAFYGEFIVFSSSRDTLLLKQRTHKWTESSFLELYKAKYDITNGNLSEATKFSKEINSKFHESTPVFTNDGNTIYFTGNHLEKNNTNGLKIYRSFKKPNGIWSEPESLPFNNDEYSVAHPSLNNNEDVLYFTSDMPGGFGQSDIYKVNILEDGSFGEVINLGNDINTEGKETFPYVSKQNMLYFSSNGHQGLGGLDIFVTQLLSDGNEDIINIGKPINGPKDDFAFIINDDTKVGYFSSNRNKDMNDDIYSFLELSKIKSFYPEIVMGFVRDKDTQEPINDARVEIYDESKQLIAVKKVDKEGKYSFILKDPKQKYSIKVTRDDYTIIEEDTDFKKFSTTYESNIELEKTNGFVILTDPKHFGSNNDEILPESKKQLDQIITLLRPNRNMNARIVSYYANENDDAIMAEKRAKLVMKYFEDNGISENRLKYEVVPQKMIQVEKVFRLMMDVPSVRFNTNSEQIRPDANPGISKVIEIMQKYPDIVVEIQGHADSRGSKLINLKVSEKRANNIKKYLVSQGINQNRLQTKGYGEQKLRNHCADGIICSKEEHEYNRRCEFMIVN